MGKFFKVRDKVAPPLLGPALAESETESLADVEPHLRALFSSGCIESEPYLVLGHLIAQLHQDPGLQVLAISSPSMGDGKTSTAISLAGILAQQHQVHVLLVEAELRRPTIATYLGIKHARTSLVEAILTPSLSLESIVRHYQPLHFDMVLAGTSVASPYDVLKLPRFAALLQEARQQYDYVVVDTPPMLPFADCRLIGRWVDGWLVVVAAHKTPRKLLAEALETTDPTKLVGLVLNKDDHQTRQHYYTYNYYTQSSNKHRKGERSSRHRKSL